MVPQMARRRRRKRRRVVLTFCLGCAALLRLTTCFHAMFLSKRLVVLLAEKSQALLNISRDCSRGPVTCVAVDRSTSCESPQHSQVDDAISEIMAILDAVKEDKRKDVLMGIMKKAKGAGKG